MTQDFHATIEGEELIRPLALTQAALSALFRSMLIKSLNPIIKMLIDAIGIRLCYPNEQRIEERAHITSGISYREKPGCLNTYRKGGKKEGERRCRFWHLDAERTQVGI
jgi:hypothetical protein